LGQAAQPATKSREDVDMDFTAGLVWLLVASAFVLFMTPGLAFFYGGMTRAKAALNMMMMSFIAIGTVTLVWVLWGASMSTSNTDNFFQIFANPFSHFGLHNFTDPADLLHVGYAATFAIITVALISGAIADRAKFSAWTLFTPIWATLVYAPLAYMVWGGGLFSATGWFGQTFAPVIDFAGGTVVHINAGVAGLIACLVMGKRKGYPGTPMPPHNLGYTLVGASMLWVGWFGFNAGSAVAANGAAGGAMAATQIATAAAALGWMFAEWLTHGKPSVLGIASGAVAGLVAVTPASGTAGPMGALILGLVAGVGCFLAATKLKSALGYDDSLDAFGVHAVGGIIGALLTGVFAAPSLGGFGTVEDIGAQLWIQTQGVLFTVIYTAVATFIILKIVDVIVGLRVSDEDESVGLDLSQHNERGYIL
jgi:Amt family ammonium transporter